MSVGTQQKIGWDVQWREYQRIPWVFRRQ
jgi:hypothetical protein